MYWCVMNIFFLMVILTTLVTFYIYLWSAGQYCCIMFMAEILYVAVRCSCVVYQHSVLSIVG